MSGLYPTTGLVHVLREDPDLAEAVAGDRREQAIEDCSGWELRIAAGPWPQDDSAILLDGLGLLILQGLLIRRVAVEGRYGAELLGEGDLVRPWQRDEEPVMLEVEIGWQVPTVTSALSDLARRGLVRYVDDVWLLSAEKRQRSDQPG